MNKSINDIIQGLHSLHLPRWEELPDLNLYMDQVLNLLNTWLEPSISKQTEKSSPAA